MLSHEKCNNCKLSGKYSRIFDGKSLLFEIEDASSQHSQQNMFQLMCCNVLETIVTIINKAM